MSFRLTEYITKDGHFLLLIFFPCLSVKLSLNIWLLNSKDNAIYNPKILIGIPISHSVLHWELQTPWSCPPPPGFSGHSWQPVPPGPAAPPSPPPWMLRSQQANGSVLFARHHGHAEMMSEAIKVTHRCSVLRRMKIKQLKRSRYLSVCFLPLWQMKEQELPDLLLFQHLLFQCLHQLGLLVDIFILIVKVEKLNTVMEKMSPNFSYSNDLMCRIAKL